MTQKLTELKKLYRTCRLTLTATLMLLVLALIVTFVNRYFCFLFLALALGCHLILTRPQQKRYAVALTKANLEATLCKQLGCPVPEEKGGDQITASLIQQSGLMPCHISENSPLLCWGIHGSYGKCKISLCDATIAQPFSLKEKGKNRVHFNSGVWAHIELPNECGIRFALYDETSVPTPIRMDYYADRSNYETAHIPDEELGNRFVLYRPTDGSTAELPKSFLASLKRLVSYTPGYLAVTVDGNQMDVFLRGRFLTKPVSAADAPSEELIAFDPFPELSYLVGLANSVH